MWSFARLQGHTLYFQNFKPKDSPNSIKTLTQTLILIVNYSLILGQGCRVQRKSFLQLAIRAS